MLYQIEEFYLKLEEPYQSFYLALHDLILNFDPLVTEHWKYKVPFFYFRGKPFCYLYMDKKSKEPYIGVVKGGLIDHPMLDSGGRKKMKIFRLNPYADIPVESLYEVLEIAKILY